MPRSKVSANILCVVAALALLTALPAGATTHGKRQDMPGHGGAMMESGMMGRGLMMPRMDPARGRGLFASKGCVVCHAVNGIGGEHAPPLDASTMEEAMNPFEFAAKMWRGAEAMIVLQREELGEQIGFTGEELAHLIAFSHHPEEQRKFSEADIPPRIKKLMHNMGEEEPHGEEGHHGTGTQKHSD